MVLRKFNRILLKLADFISRLTNQTASTQQVEESSKKLNKMGGFYRKEGGIESYWQKERLVPGKVAFPEGEKQRVSLCRLPHPHGAS